MNYILARSITTTHQHLILFPTEKCNFRCTYCYEKFEIGKMPSNIVHAVNRFILNRMKTVKSFHLGWFGGEPLVNFDIVKDITDVAYRSAIENGVSFKGDMTTNGYLLDQDTFAFLVNNGVKEFQISIDGYGDFHDKTRVLRGGGGSFDVILNNIISAMSSSFEFVIVLRVHFLSSTLPYVDGIIDLINQRWGGDERLKVHFAPVQKLGNIDDSILDIIPQQEQEDVVKSLRGKLRSKGQALILNSQENPYVCYASKMNSIAIRANGKISKCTVALYNERNDIGYIKEDGSIVINQAKIKKWGIGLETGNLQQLACPAHAVLTQ